MAKQNTAPSILYRNKVGLPDRIQVAGRALGRTRVVDFQGLSKEDAQGVRPSDIAISSFKHAQHIVEGLRRTSGEEP